jgi:hypothetical protein
MPKAKPNYSSCGIPRCNVSQMRADGLLSAIEVEILATRIGTSSFGHTAAAGPVPGFAPSCPCVRTASRCILGPYRSRPLCRSALEHYHGLERLNVHNAISFAASRGEDFLSNANCLMIASQLRPLRHCFRTNSPMSLRPGETCGFCLESAQRSFCDYGHIMEFLLPFQTLFDLDQSLILRAGEAAASAVKQFKVLAGQPNTGEGREKASTSHHSVHRFGRRSPIQTICRPSESLEADESQRSLRMRTSALQHAAGSKRTYCRQGLVFLCPVLDRRLILPANLPNEPRLLAADRQSSRCNIEVLSWFSLFNEDFLC